MKKSLLILYLLLLFFTFNTIKAQTFIKLQLGLSYIENFSTGFELSIKNKHNISILYGSNFFSKPQDFSSFMLQYDYAIDKLEIAHLIPHIGIKGGYSIYTNNYYQWELIALVPFIGTNYQINKRIDLSTCFGVAFSKELSMKRINYGEVGWYKKVLPEIKIAIKYKLNRGL